jgi:hypothetical protein
MAKKKNTAPEQKPLTLTDMKVQVALLTNKADTYIAKQQQNIEKYVQAAAAKKIKGQDASWEIKHIVSSKKYVEMAEKRKYIATTLLEKREMMEFEVKFMKEMNSLMKDFSVATKQFEGAEQFAADFARMSAQLSEEEQKMDDLMSGMDAALSATADFGAFSEAEKTVNANIDKQIADLQMSAENLTTEEMAKRISQTLK